MSKAVNLLILALLVALVDGQSAISVGMSTLTMSSMSMTTIIPTPSTSNASVASYTINALPAIQSQPSCIYNCLIPIGLADPSGCNDVTNECACLSAPADVIDFLTDCVQTVCQFSTSAYGSVATGLYESYCKSVFGAAQFSQAFSAEAAAAASTTTAGTGESSSMVSTASLTPSATKASGTVGRGPSLLMATLSALVALSLFFML